MLLAALKGAVWKDDWTKWKFDTRIFFKYQNYSERTVRELIGKKSKNRFRQELCIPKFANSQGLRDRVKFGELPFKSLGVNPRTLAKDSLASKIRNG